MQATQASETTIEEGILYLSELLVVGVIYSNLDNNQSSKDLAKIQCMWSMWRKFVWNRPILHEAPW